MLSGMRANCTPALLLCLLIATTACGRTDLPQVVPTRDGKRSYEEFKASVGSFPYNAPRERRERILAGYSKLDVGVTKDEVAAAIGEPDYSQLNYGPKGPNMPLIGSSWVYYLSKRGDRANNLDPVVHVFFGTDGRARWIVPSNIEGLHEKGSPLQRT